MNAQLALQSFNETTIELVRTQEQLDEVAHFRYKIYCEELGYDLHRADLKRRMLTDDIDERGFTFMAKMNGEIVGTGRISEITDADISHYPELNLQQIVDRYGKSYFVTKFMVRADLRKSHVFMEIAARCYEFSTTRGARAFVVFCYDHLCPTFKKIGFQSYMAPTTIADFGRVNPIVLENTEENLRKVRSPLLRAYRRLFPAVTSVRSPSFSLSVSGPF